jgi:hypothetical protein
MDGENICVWCLEVFMHVSGMTGRHGEMGGETRCIWCSKTFMHVSGVTD